MECSSFEDIFNQLRYSIISSGNIKNIPDAFLRKLEKRITPITLKKEKQEKHSIIDLAFFPVVSRTGTDIDAALSQLKDEKPVILVVLHHTFDPEAVVSGSNKFVRRKNTCTVDCLFYEDQGLLKCKRNKDAYNEAGAWLKSQKSLLQKQKKEQRKGQSNNSKSCVIL